MILMAIAFLWVLYTMHAPLWCFIITVLGMIFYAVRRLSED